MAKLLDKLSGEMNKLGYEKRSPKSRTWLKSQIKDLNGATSRRSLIQSRENMKPRSALGRMYFYYYDAKTKDKLPYWDRFPLTIPIEKYNDGFLGLNLHYLPPNYRLVLLDKLYEFTTNDKFNETTRMKLSYELLSGLTRLKEFSPCLKRYLFSHLKSQFIEVPADQWEIAIFLPVEQFVGATTAKVHRETRKELRGKK